MTERLLTSAPLAVVDFEDASVDVDEDELMGTQEVLRMPRRLCCYHPPYLWTQQPRPHSKHFCSVLIVLRLQISLFAYIISSCYT